MNGIGNTRSVKLQKGFALWREEYRTLLYEKSGVAILYKENDSKRYPIENPPPSELTVLSTIKMISKREKMKLRGLELTKSVSLEWNRRQEKNIEVGLNS